MRNLVHLFATIGLLMVGVLLLVFGFRSSSALSAAYGIAVSLLMAITTLLAALARHLQPEAPAPQARAPR